MKGKHLKVITSEKAAPAVPCARSETVFAPGVIRVLEETLERARAGHIAGITVISYAPDWTWNTTNAGAVLSVPAVGIAAAHLLSSQFERSLRAGQPEG